MAYHKPKRITLEMPQHHHKDDAEWIDSKLSTLQQDERGKVCFAYNNVFVKAHNAEPAPHRKDGKARFAANNRLRIYIAKKFAVFNK